MSVVEFMRRVHNFQLKGSKDVAVVRALASHQCDSGLGIICGLRLLLVLVLASRDFSPSTLVFSSPLKINISKFHFNLEIEGHRFVSHTDC